jgi:hypothetical protein
VTIARYDCKRSFSIPPAAACNNFAIADPRDASEEAAVIV